MLSARTAHLVIQLVLALFIAFNLCVVLVKMENMSTADIDAIPEFAHGLKIMLLDHDLDSLMHTASVLEQFSFNVTAIQQASVALSMISKQKGHYELVMANTNMSDSNSVPFLHVLLEKNIPVILMSSEMDAQLTKKALDKGASFLLEKPIPMEDLKNVWQEVYWQTIPMKGTANPNFDEWMNWLEEPEGTQENEDMGVLRPSSEGIETKEDSALCRPENGNCSETDLESKYMEFDTPNTCPLTRNPGNIHLANELHETDLHNYSTKEFFPTESDKQKESGTKRLADDNVNQGKGKRVKPTVEQTSDRNQEEIKKHSSDKTLKTRIVWTSELHHKFTKAISVLGDEKARPKAILNMMGVKNVTLRQVASHLQKYKNQVRRINETGIFTGRTRLSNFCSGNVPPKQSSLLFHQKQGTSRFGVGGRPTESTTPNSLTRSSISVASFNNHDYRMQNLNSRHEGFSRYGNHNSLNISLISDGWFQHMNHTSVASSSAPRTDLMGILKNKQPIGLEDSMVKVTENLPSMTSMASEVDTPNMSANTFQLPNQPPVVHQEQYYTPNMSNNTFQLPNQPPVVQEKQGHVYTPGLTDPLVSRNQGQVSTVIARNTEVLEIKKISLRGRTYSIPNAILPQILANAFQFSYERSVVTQEQNCTPVASDPMNSATGEKFSTEDVRSEFHELMQMNLPSMNYLTPEDTSVNQEQYYAQAHSSSYVTQNIFSPEFAETNELDFLLDSPRTKYMTDGDGSTQNSENAVQLPNEHLDMDLEQHCTPELTGQKQFSAETTELEFLVNETPSCGGNNLGNLPLDFNDGSQKLNTTTGVATPAMSFNEYQHYAPAFTTPFSDQHQNKVSAATAEHELLSEQLASSYAKSLQNIPADFNGESQMSLIGESPPAVSSNESQPLSEYDDLLKMIEADPEEFNSSGNVLYAGDISDQLEWLQKILFEDSTEQY